MLVLGLLIAQVAQAQRLQVTNENGDPIIGANLKVTTFSQTPQVFWTTSDELGVAPIPLTSLQKIVIFCHIDGYKPFNDTIDFSGELALIKLIEYKHTLSEQIITAQYGAIAREKSVYNFRVIDQNFLQTSGAVTLKDALANLTNIRIQQDAAIGASALSLQGLGGQNVKILMDGVPVIGRLDGNIDLSQISIQNIERIEIIEGPMAVNYGSDALGGVINLITKKNTSEKPRFNANFYAETIGQFNQDFRFSARIKRKNKITATSGRNFFQGWNPAKTGDTRAFLWKPKEQYNAGLQYERTFGKWNVLFNNTFFYEKLLNRDSIRGLPYKAYALDQLYITSRYNNSLYINNSIENGRSIDLIFSHAYYGRRKQTFVKDLVALSERPSQDPTLQDTVIFRQFVARGVYTMNKAGKKINYQLGYDNALDFGVGGRVGAQTRKIGDFALFASGEYRPFRRLTLRPGLRASYNTKYNTPIIPSLHIKYDITEQIALRLSYGAGFRAPGLKELYLYFVDANHNIRGNENLKPETSHNLAAHLSRRRIYGQTLLTLEAGGFYNFIRNLIQLSQVEKNVGLYSYVNIGTYESTGGQATVKISREMITIQSTFALIGRKSKFSSGETPFLFSPEVSANIFYNFSKLNLKLALFYKYNGRLNGYKIDENERIFPTFIAAYQLLDASLTKGFWKNKIECVVGSKNLFNVINVNAFQPAGVHSGGASSAAVSVGRTFFCVLRFNF